MANGRFLNLTRLFKIGWWISYCASKTSACREWRRTIRIQTSMKTLFCCTVIPANSMDLDDGRRVCELAGIITLAVVWSCGDKFFYLDGPETGA